MAAKRPERNTRRGCNECEEQRACRSSPRPLSAFASAAVLQLRCRWTSITLVTVAACEWATQRSTHSSGYAARKHWPADVGGHCGSAPRHTHAHTKRMAQPTLCGGRDGIDPCDTISVQRPTLVFCPTLHCAQNSTSHGGRDGFDAHRQNVWRLGRAASGRRRRRKQTNALPGEQLRVLLHGHAAQDLGTEASGGAGAGAEIDVASDWAGPPQQQPCHTVVSALRK